MTPLEFKAWFEGFTEAFTGTPTKAQWARIKERVAQIDGLTITERIFVDRWWPLVRPAPYYSYPQWSCLGSTTKIDCCVSGGVGVGSAGYNTNMNLNADDEINCTFSPVVAMVTLGRAEAAALNG